MPNNAEKVHQATGVFVIPFIGEDQGGQVMVIRSDSSENGFKAENVKVFGGVLKDGSSITIETDDPCPGHADFQFPGGGMEAGETVGDTANREFSEEVWEVVLQNYAQGQGVSIEELPVLEVEQLETEYSAVFSELSGVMEEVEEILVQQFLVDEESGERTLRGIFNLVMVAVELTSEQQQFLHNHGAVFPLNEAMNNGATLRPYVQTLVDLGVIQSFIGEDTMKKEN